MKLKELLQAYDQALLEYNQAWTEFQKEFEDRWYMKNNAIEFLEEPITRPTRVNNLESISGAHMKITTALDKLNRTKIAYADYILAKQRVLITGDDKWTLEST